MNIEPITLAIGSLITASVPALGTLVYARNQWKASNRADGKQVIDAVEQARKAEKDECREHLERFERRLDSCEAKHEAANELIAELAGLVGAPNLARRARSMSPPAMRAVNPEEKK